MYQPRHISVDLVGQRQRALTGHVFCPEASWDAVGIMVVPAKWVTITERGRHDPVGEKQVGIAESITGDLGDTVAGIA